MYCILLRVFVSYIAIRNRPLMYAFRLLWLANLVGARVFYELITSNYQIEANRMFPKHGFYFQSQYHCKRAVYLSATSLHAKCARKLLTSILLQAWRVFVPLSFFGLFEFLTQSSPPLFLFVFVEKKFPRHTCWKENCFLFLSNSQIDAPC